MMHVDAELLAASLRLAAPLYYAALGGIVCERAGVLNVGLEGLMLMGAISANVATVLTGSLVLGIVFGVLGGVVFGFALGILMVRIKTDQLVVGIAFNIFALGFSTFIREVIFGVNAGPNAVRTPPFPVLDPAWLGQLPFVGAILSRQTYLSFLILLLPFPAWFLIGHTRLGLTIRLVGESARTADALGVDVARVRMGAVVVGSALAALGGADLALADVNYFVTNMTAGRGYMALAAVILGRWDPVLALLVCLVFGAADATQFRLQAMSLNIVPQLSMMIPYIVALLLMLIFRGQAIPPAEDGKPYYRE
jgi:simple sugar transport system permease protein